MNNGLPSPGRTNGLGSSSPVLRPDSEQPTASGVEQSGAEVPVQELRDNKLQRILPEEPQVLLPGLNPSFPPADLLQDTISSSASDIPTDKAEAESSVVEDNVTPSSPIIGDSHNARYRNNGAPALSRPISENRTAKNILGTSQHHDMETLDDIRFPEYFLSPDDEAQSLVEPQGIQATSETLEWANEATKKVARGIDQETKHSEDEIVNFPEDDSPFILPLNHSSAAAPLGSSPQSQVGGHTGGELREAELPNDVTDYQSQKTAGHENGLHNNYFPEANAENMDSSGQPEEYKGAPSVPTDEEARFGEGLPLLPTSSAQDGPTAQLGQVKGHEAVSPTWFHGTEEDLLGEGSPSSQHRSSNFGRPPLDRKTTTQVLDSLNHSARDPMLEDSDRVDQPSQVEFEDSSPNTTSLQGDAENQGTSTATETGGSPMTKESQEEDLAAKWRAALGDDDLLEEVETSFDPSSFFIDDGEGFLDDNQTQVPEATLPSSRESTHIRGGDMQPYGQPNTSSGVHVQNKAPAPLISQKDIGAPSPLIQSSPPIPQSVQASTSFQSPQDQSAYLSKAARPRIPESTQSFSDKSQAGYTSPYDLPMEVTRPKKRTYLKQTQTTSDIRASSHPPPPPPRSSSISSAIISPVVDSYPMSHNAPDANAALNTFDPKPPLARAASAVVTARPSTGSFFEELPFTKPRPANLRSKPALGTAQSNPIPQAPFERGPPHHSSLSQRPASSLAGTSPGYQLVPPERMALFSHAHDESLNKVPAINSRYSPAPPSQNIIPPIQNRYVSSSSVPRPHQPPHSMSFQPRKSSPLAQSNSVSQHHQRSSAGDIPRTSPQEGNPVEPPVPHNMINPQNQNERGEMQVNEIPQAGMENSRITSSPRFAEPAPSENRYAPVSRIPSKSPNAPQQATNMDPPPVKAFTMSNNQRPSNRPSEAPPMEPPRRSQTQSPSAARPKLGLPLNIQELVQRPASTNHQAAPIHSRSAYVGVSRQEAPSRSLNYIAPTDGREHDLLERWKGCPILAFGFGGLTVTSFPKQIPRYSAGQTTPMIKCSPGEVNLRVGKTLRLDESLASFPGPLRSKGKKREVLDWLKKRIIHMENLHIPASSDSISMGLQQRSEEQILLWKFLQIIVEHDGVVEGNSIAITAMRSLLTPEVVVHDPKHPSEFNFNEGVGISMHGGPMRSSNPDTLESIRRFLLRGEREKAVWCAVDQGMWDHAMLISSTLQPDVWKQVLREFVRQGVRKSGSNTESLASLYQVFAGNWEESIDELVPPSARAGLQMVSMATGAVPPKNALEGLDRWRETLTLILNNRSHDDTNALVALGRLLSNYGRTEAAHICYLFGKTPGLFGGADDPRVAITLLGADHHNHPFDYDRDFNSILLTEVYEFATTVLAPSTGAGSPHLQAYKLYHAMQLAEYGFKSEAQQYCDAITTALKSTTKLPPYYHSLFFGALEDLVERLRQAPKDGSQSWISKPSMDKVSGSVWAKLNQFIAGDESDTNSAVSGKALDQDVNGPFARVSGDSPSLSRTPSSSDLYSGYQAGGGIARSAPTTVPNSRYALTGQYTPRSSLEQSSSFSQEPRQQSAVEGQRPFMSHVQYQPQQRSSTEIQQGSPPKPHKPPRQPSTYTPQNQSYLPTSSSQLEYTVPPVEVSSVLNNNESDLPIPYLEQPGAKAAPPPMNDSELNTNNYLPPLYSNQSSSIYEASATNTYSPLSNTGESPPHGYSPPSYTYEPPSSTYDPPSYDPETTNDPESPQKNPKKKTFGDDDDDEEFVKRAAALLKEDRARKDRETDEAFRKAAEADGKLPSPYLLNFQSKLIRFEAQKEPKLNAKKSWFGGWLGGKKEGDSSRSPSNGPIRAKLGEESSFYYDSNLKKWVNKKAGETASEVVVPKAPPPRGPPSRAVSAASMVPPPSTTPPVPALARDSTPPFSAINLPPINITKPPTSSPQLPPSPTRSFSSAAALPSKTEEAPALPPMPILARPEGFSSSAPPSRPATAMSEASSIDDLLGQPQARKGGTVRRGKKAGRYVDIMAK